ncbi:hypothetical protein [Eggerthella sinensis]|uniref:hypothetical protein n=1 Tax=Eggerthella sinensis TaxID=242230 RepID=UPI0022DF86E7|nr:hypothetical protein [Eggerthella sinensis]
MDTEGVFAVGVSGMGPALSPQGERIVNAKMEARNRMLDDLERRGLNVDALTHRHRACNQDCNQPASDAPAQSEPDTLAAAHARIQHRSTSSSICGTCWPSKRTRFYCFEKPSKQPAARHTKPGEAGRPARPPRTTGEKERTWMRRPWSRGRR